MRMSAYHAGERRVQQDAGELDLAERNGTVIAGTMLPGARPFLEKQSMVVLASLDAQGHPWCSILYGEPGFVHADGADTLDLDVDPAQRDPGDPVWDNVATNPVVGMLFIELGSRRRYRINGSIGRLDRKGLRVHVREAFPNCPKYIQRRHLRRTGGGFRAEVLADGQALDGEALAIVHKADTVFVASSHADTGADASHRGGNPGFVEVLQGGLLRMPDYAGNSMFKTFGNLQLDPRVGLCVPDFEGGRILQLAGRAVLRHGQPDPAGLSGGTGRFCEIEVDRWIVRRAPLQLEWEYLDASPFNPTSGAA